VLEKREQVDHNYREEARRWGAWFSLPS